MPFNKEPMIPAEQLDALVKATPTRQIIYRHCVGCGHDWSQPSREGACPRCHGYNVVNEGEKISAYKQL